MAAPHPAYPWRGELPGTETRSEITEHLIGRFPPSIIGRMAARDQPVEELMAALGASWPVLRAARARAAAHRTKLEAELQDEGVSDGALVVFGSLARGEYTVKSDLDWTLLVDGPAKPEQLASIPRIRKKLLASGSIGPTAGGPFGSISSSFELVHRIGGDADTNRIMTQRVLLLLESAPLDLSPEGFDRRIHDRVVRSVLQSYLDQSAGVTRGSGVPRFLLNDVVRYWRTMAVDYSAKRRERDDEGWALRLLKLRTSRKLIFAAGLLMCLDYHVREIHPRRADPSADALMDNLVEHVRRTPLDSLAVAALADPEIRALARPVFDHYERFLAFLDDETQREGLRRLHRDATALNPLFEEAERIGNDFGSSIEGFFFDGPYARAMREYGIF